MTAPLNDPRLPERFWIKVSIDPESGCWRWTAATSKGYGRYGTTRRQGTQPAHRIAYEALVAKIPEGLVLDHTCHNGTGCPGGSTCIHRRCVNPAHLEPVTHAQNIARGESPGAVIFRTGACAAGHPMDEENIYVDPSGARHCRSCRRDALAKWMNANRELRNARRRKRPSDWPHHIHAELKEIR